MKYIVILGDGMADEPIAELGNKTPLQVARKPYIDKITAAGRCGLLQTIPKEFGSGSEIANLSVLGFDVNKVYEGRGVLEAASMGVPIKQGEMAMRCNLICIENKKIKNHSAGHITSEEAAELIQFLNKELGSEIVKFHSGVSYRHLIIVKGGNKQIECTPPHDVPGTPWKDVLIKAKIEEAKETADFLNDLIIRSQKLLEKHPINIARKKAGKDPANSIWLWSPGYKPKMQTLLETYDLRNGVVISAVDLIKGIGIYAGLQPIEVEGATGLVDTNYEGKAMAAIKALKNNDFVYLHVEASDEAGHEGDVPLKIKTIEYLDNRIVRPIWEHLQTLNEPVSIAILPDHPTPCAKRTHTTEPVPFVIYRPGHSPDGIALFDEKSAQQGYYGLMKAEDFMYALVDMNIIKEMYHKMKLKYKEFRGK